MSYRLERAIFIKVGWMEFYGFRPEDGGPAADSAEVANFEDIKGRAYGLVNVATINLARLGAESGSMTQNGCVVVSVAPRPEGGGQVVVGWQGRAMIRNKRKLVDGTERLYNYTTATENCVLLPNDARQWEVPTTADGIKQAKLVYALGDRNKPRPWAVEILANMDQYEADGGDNLLTAG